MPPGVQLEGAGVRFTVPRQSLSGRRRPRLLRGARNQVWGLRDVTFGVDRGEIVGLVGPNGAGKTTLLRAVAGIYRADEGTVTAVGHVCPVLSLSGGLRSELTGWANIDLSAALLGLSMNRVKELAPAIAEFSELTDFLDAEVRVYSSGMAARLGFSIAALADPDVLVVDEVITVADEAFRIRSGHLLKDLAAAGKTVMAASHDVESLVDLCDRLVWLEKGHIREVGAAGDVAERYLRFEREEA